MLLRCIEIFRGHLRRSFDKIRGPAFIMKVYTNQTDFFTLEELKDIEITVL